MPAGLFGGPMLFEPTRPVSLALQQNKNLSVLTYVEVFWWARVDVASRASKKAPQGLFYPPDYSAGRCCSNPPSRVRLKMSGKTKTSVISTLVLLVGAGGFEPPKLKAADLQSVPIGHSGTRPYSLFVSFAGRLAYSIMKKGFCQLFFYLFLQMRFPCRETAGKALQPCRHGKVGEKSQPEEIDRQIARKTRDNM